MLLPCTATRRSKLHPTLLRPCRCSHYQNKCPFDPPPCFLSHESSISVHSSLQICYKRVLTCVQPEQPVRAAPARAAPGLCLTHKCPCRHKTAAALQVCLLMSLLQKLGQSLRQQQQQQRAGCAASPAASPTAHPAPASSPAAAAPRSPRWCTAAAAVSPPAPGQQEDVPRRGQGVRDAAGGKAGGVGMTRRQGAREGA